MGHIILKKDLTVMPTPTSFFKEHGKVIAQMREASEAYPKENVVFLFAGGLSYKSLIYRAYRNFGHKDTIIDVGDSLDYFTGREGGKWNEDLAHACRAYPHYLPEGRCIQHVAAQASP